jgi:acetoacetate decarboxylase
MIKIIPHVDCTPRICELLLLHGGRLPIGRLGGSGCHTALRACGCDVARLPVREVVSATHYITDLTLGLGEVVFDYMKDA